jgi:hypothetical protein
MTLVAIAGGIFFALGAVAMYFPVLIFEHSDVMSGAELGRRYPRFAWMRFGYPILVLSLFAAAIWLGVDLFGDGERGFYLPGALFFTVPILNGSIGLLTGVCPFFDKFQYFYARDKHVYKASLRVIALGVLGLLAFWLLPMILPPVKVF